MDTWSFYIAITVIVIHLLWYLILPTPLPGIPYNVSSAHNLFGDLPAITSHISATGGSLVTFFNSTLRSLNVPLAQVFIKPLGKPVLILSDFRETHGLLMARKEFDRSPALGDLLKGLIPDHHIHLKTDARWRAQRRLVQDLMMPSYLNNVAGPAIYQTVTDMLQLWRMKSRIADGRPWVASVDVKLMSLDAMMGFAFGPSSEHNATKLTIDTIKKLFATQNRVIKNAAEPVKFPDIRLDNVLQAMLDLAATVMELHGSPAPYLHWAYLNLKPSIKRAKKIKDDYITQQLKDGLERLDHTVSKTMPVTCAVDQMILRERSLAEKDGREPRHFSNVMMDEVSILAIVDVGSTPTDSSMTDELPQLFGFIFAGNETTATTICWALKFLTSHPATQNKLRNALKTAFGSADADNRDPTIEEIVCARVPYLDAVMEEVLRCAGTSPFVDRQATVDTQILGQHVPQGTVVLCLLSGSSMWSPGFDIDEKLRYSSRHEGASSASGRGDKAWDPENISAFQPERWLVPSRTDNTEGNEYGGAVEFNPTAGPQLAFGLGPRGCFGRRLVYLELRILLSLTVWRFELLGCPEELSSYKSVLRATNEPRQCYVRLRDIRSE